MRPEGEERETLEWYEARRKGQRPKRPKKDEKGKGETKEYEKQRTEGEERGRWRERERTECISAPAAETRDERRSALEDTDTFVREDTKK